MMIFENMLRKKAPSRKDHVLYNSIYNSYPKPENSHAQKAE